MGFHKGFFIVIALVILIGLSFRVAMVSKALTNNEHSYEITVPTYNGNSDVYFTTQYKESGNCITFKDEFGIEQKVCGNYQVKKW